MPPSRGGPVLESEAGYRGTSLTRKRSPLGPYSRPMPIVLRGSSGGGCFLMSEVPLYVQDFHPRRNLHSKPGWHGDDRMRTIHASVSRRARTRLRGGLQGYLTCTKTPPLARTLP